MIFMRTCFAQINISSPFRNPKIKSMLQKSSIMNWTVFLKAKNTKTSMMSTMNLIFVDNKFFLSSKFLKNRFFLKEYQRILNKS